MSILLFEIGFGQFLKTEAEFHPSGGKKRQHSLRLNFAPAEVAGRVQGVGIGLGFTVLGFRV